MIKLIDLDDLNRAISSVEKELKKMKLNPQKIYRFTVDLYWPDQGNYHLDAGTLHSIVSKSLVKLGFDMNRNFLGCGLHQISSRAGQIEIKAEAQNETLR